MLRAEHIDFNVSGAARPRVRSYGRTRNNCPEEFPNFLFFIFWNKKNENKKRLQKPTLAGGNEFRALKVLYFFFFSFFCLFFTNINRLLLVQNELCSTRFFFRRFEFNAIRRIEPFEFPKFPNSNLDFAAVVGHVIARCTRLGTEIPNIPAYRNRNLLKLLRKRNLTRTLILFS